MAGPLVFPDPDSFPTGWDNLWDAPNQLTYKWITKSPSGSPLRVGYWNVVGTVGREGPMGPTGEAGANGLHPTINSSNGCWTYNYTDFDINTGIGTDKSEPTNYPSVGSVRILGVKAKKWVDELNTDPKWDERRAYNRNDAFMVETEDIDTGLPISTLYVIPWHELIDGDGNVEDTDDAKLAHSFVDMGYLGVQGPQGKKGDQGKTGAKGVGKCQIVLSMPRGEEEGEMFLDKTTNTMFIAVEPVSN